ncbi:MAG TPA: glycosyltransferase family 39 protein [Vicinamibacterales bacterium]|nr:glycosyltransferase family 39 protein [Vicinamibacterales bacterium]
MSDRVGRSFVATLLIAFAAAAALRCAWLTADPPAHPAVGIMWHDEGAWVHNARNRVLWGAWRADEWNPVFVAPAFTALEYAAFRTFGIGTWQARTVPVASGLLAVALLAAGLAALGGRRAALIGASLLATNYVYVMWNRAALMESTMTAFIVASWAAYAFAERRPALGLLAGTAVVFAWFTKASAAFFVAALVLDAVATLVQSRWEWPRRVVGFAKPSRSAVRAARWTLTGVAATGAVILVAFVLPYWSEYQFYNWQMSVTRKPSYTLRSLIDRASWLPIVHDYFTRMWLVTSVAALGLTTIVLTWRTARPGERLLVLWVLLGLAELVVHDAGNERRYVMFIPALVALTALVLGKTGPIGAPTGDLGRFSRWIALPLVLLLAYLVAGSLVRLALLGEIGRGVRLSAAMAVIAGGLIFWRWRSVCEWLSRQRITAGAAAALTAIAIAGDLTQYWQWALGRTYENHQASIELGRVLPPGTLVHGKLANGLSLENRIRPIFVGRGFGNYDDRTTRDDVRYILTYIAPRVGYEGSVIRDVLDAYPNRTIIMTFDVAETATGRDRAALIDKFGGAGPGTNRQATGRADH